MREIKVIHLGRTNYQSAWDLQRKLFDLRIGSKIPDVLLLTEHNHVYTFGKSSDDNHLLATEHELNARGAEVYHIDRGGDITYHGPGQLVGYPILDLNNYGPDIHRYLRSIEEAIIRTLAGYGVSAHRDNSFTGVWVDNDKIAAIGIKVSRWVTMHGFACNINTDLSYFDRIIPCGIFHRGVTSMERLLHARVAVDEVSKILTKHFSEVFGAGTVESSVEELFSSLESSVMENFEWHRVANQ